MDDNIVSTVTKKIIIKLGHNKFTDIGDISKTYLYRVYVDILNYLYHSSHILTTYERVR